jgi:hypothetical protein
MGQGPLGEWAVNSAAVQRKNARQRNGYGRDMLLIK